jgi:hypothetical protein
MADIKLRSQDPDFLRFEQAYVEALLWAELPEGVEGDPELSAEAEEDVRADCLVFWKRIAPYLKTEVVQEAFPDPVEQAGHDFLLTRQGHGVGFWETEWPQPYRDMFTKWAEQAGEIYVDVGDEDGNVYIN